jgi:putative N-acetyltransferase (TIGR04045 family)
MLYEDPTRFTPCEYRCKLAAEPWELAGYWRLRREVFCAEQRMFHEDDRDEHDAQAFPIVAISLVMGMPDRVAGTVRIDQRGPRLWIGSRLTVHPDFRGVAGLGASLVRKAVSSARGMGCDRFRAMVQRQNVAFFRRLNWRSIEESLLLGRPHHLMEAELAHYPPCDLAYPVQVVPARRAS